MHFSMLLQNTAKESIPGGVLICGNTNIQATD